jgi:uncharacterized protein (TIGR02246 family)
MRLAHPIRALPIMMALALLLPSVATGQGIERPRVPLRTALDELRALRETYAETFTKGETATLVDMYAPDAILIRGDGTVLTGKDAIEKGFEARPRSGPRPRMTIESDTVRVFGNTAYDVGTTRVSDPQGHEDVSHYLAVFRRGLKAWKISSVAVVPERKAGASDSTEH